MTLHQFSPSLYHPTFGHHPPILKIKSGDSIELKLIDAHGLDKTGKKHTEFSNPLVGPFFVEGLEPGDSLRVFIESVQPDRETGWSYATPASTVVDTSHIESMPGRKQVTWKIDYTSQSASLAKPSPALEKLQIPLAPMIGCLGVAPDHWQAITSYSSGSFGGNIDCPLVKTGCKIDFPIFTQGGLLFLGDMHAVQSHGEISSAAIEISGTVRFSVQVIKEQTITYPHGENETCIFTIGSGRPLDQAMQNATSEMLRWLCDIHNLSEEEASLVMSQSVKYIISNAVNEKFTIACMLDKTILTNL